MATPLDYTVQSEEDGSNIQHVEEPNENSPPEVEETEEESEEITRKIEELRQRGEPINIVVIGPTGAGKSTFINNMMGETVAKVSASMASEQSAVEVHEGEHEGIRIRVYDTVGFGDSEGQSNFDILKDINAKGDFDLVLLCIDFTKRADQPLQDLLADLKSNLHIESWKHMVVVFTFTNNFIDLYSMRALLPNQKKTAVDENINNFKPKMYSRISGCVAKDTFDKIPFCTAGIGGDGNIEPLFQENWLNPLWVSCVNQCSDKAYPLLKDLAENRLGKKWYHFFSKRNERNSRGQQNSQGNSEGQQNPSGQGNSGRQSWCPLI